MAMKYFSDHDPADVEKAEINMSPLIDMTFLLLIFFMVTTVFIQDEGVKINKPAAATAESLEAEQLILVLNKDGSVMHTGRAIGQSEVAYLIKDATKNSKRSVLIVTDSSTPTGVLVHAIDICRLAGAKTVNIAASKEAK